MSSRIIATAAKAPDQVIANDDLAKIVDTSDEWIVQRTGIRSRHISNGENTSVFVIDVAKQLIEKASVNAEDIDLIIVASVTPDYGTPSLACMVQKEIHAINAVAFDITAAGVFLSLPASISPFAMLFTCASPIRNTHVIVLSVSCE